MELPGSNYLLTLATISITFVSFSTVVVVFRQVLGTGLSGFQIILIRFFIVSGFGATGFSLMPALLGLFGIPPSLVWRLSSFALASMILFGLIVFLRHRSLVQQGSLPLRIYVLYSISIAIILLLFINAIGIVIEPTIGPYALGATWMLVGAMIAFVATFRIFLEPPQKG